MNPMRTPVNWDMVPIVMDLAYASVILRKTPENLKKRAQRGEFPAVKDGRDWRVTKEALRKHLGLD